MKCDFCDEQKGIRTVFNEIYDIKDRLIFETESFRLFPCMGCLREGHLLIASKKHYNAIGALDSKAMIELQGLIQEVVNFYRTKYKRKTVVFEHGVTDDSGKTGGCGISHMHMHLLPMSREEYDSVSEIVNNSKQNTVRQFETLQEVKNLYENQITYTLLSFLDSKDKIAHNSCIITSDKNHFESQYMRKVVSEVLKKREWDWRKIKNPEPEFLKTYTKAKEFFLNDNETKPDYQMVDQVLF